MAAEAVGDVVVLLEVAAQREVQEGPAGGGELHGRGEAAVADREVAGRQVAVEPVHVAERLDAVAVWERRRVDARSAHDDHPQPGMRRRASGNAAAARSSRRMPAAEPPAATMQTSPRPRSRARRAAPRGRRSRPRRSR